MITPTELMERLGRSGLCPPSRLKGCTEKDLAQIESHIGHSLPLEYKRLMLVLGRSTGDFLSDVTMHYPDVLSLTQEVRTLLEEYDVELPADVFVFADRDGEQCLFFHLDDNPDPPIFRWADDRPERFRKVFNSIWEFVEEEVAGQEAQLQDGDDEEGE